jgi:hypothetical protein
MRRLATALVCALFIVIPGLPNPYSKPAPFSTLAAPSG